MTKKDVVKIQPVKKDTLPLPLNAQFSWADMKLNSDGMVPVIVQDYKTKDVHL